MKHLVIWVAVGALWAGVLPISQAAAATVSVTGSPFDAGDFSGYGSTVYKHQVVNNPASGVTDPTNGAAWLVGGGVTPTVSDYVVDWYFLGSESGYIITFSGGVPVVSFTEHNTINHVPNAYLGTSTTLNPITLAPGGGHVAFAYLQFTGPDSAVLTTAPTDWFIFAYNDSWQGDGDYDDYVGYAHVRATPIPAALPLMGTGLGIGYLMSKWAKRRRSRQPAPVVA
jgi:hypothetical protein